MVTVRRATLQDREAIFRFIQQAYESRWQYKIPDRWQWEYVDNPFLANRQLPIWIAVEDDGRVVGQTCALVEPLKIGSTLTRVGWSVDTFLLPEYRGQGIGFQLQKANDEANPIFMSLSMTAANRKIKAGLGSVPIDPVPGFVRLIRYEPESIREAAVHRLAATRSGLAGVLKAVLRFLLLDRAAAVVLNAWVEARDRSRLPALDPAIQISPVEKFGPEMNSFWSKLSACFYAIVPRDEMYLNWKFVQQPLVKYARYIARRNGEICGYIILREGQPPERHLGVIADLMAWPEDESALLTLITFALHYFKKARVKDVMAASTISAYQKTLLELGFRQAKGAFPMFHCKLQGPEFEAALEPGRWFLGKADHDWDQYPVAHF